jgi:SAM-dependent methyltransferase
MSTSPLSLDPLVVYNLPGSEYLDVGAGLGKWGFLLKKYRWFLGSTASVTGLDLFRPHLDALASHGIYDHLIEGSATSLPFPDKSFDSAVACEVLEHLDQSDGSKLISELRRVCRQSFVVTTPNFPCLRDGGDTPDGFNPYEAHKHNFLYPEFATLGFTQIVGLGLKSPSHRLRHLFRAFDSAAYYLPRYSRLLVGCWFADGKRRELNAY